MKYLLLKIQYTTFMHDSGVSGGIERWSHGSKDKEICFVQKYMCNFLRIYKMKLNNKRELLMLHSQYLNEAHGLQNGTQKLKNKNINSGQTKPNNKNKQNTISHFPDLRLLSSDYSIGNTCSLVTNIINFFSECFISFDF